MCANVLIWGIQSSGKTSLRQGPSPAIALAACAHFSRAPQGHNAGPLLGGGIPREGISAPRRHSLSWDAGAGGPGQPSARLGGWG